MKNWLLGTKIWLRQNDSLWFNFDVTIGTPTMDDCLSSRMIRRHLDAESVKEEFLMAASDVLEFALEHVKEIYPIKYRNEELAQQRPYSWTLPRNFKEAINSDEWKSIVTDLQDYFYSKFKGLQKAFAELEKM